MPSLHMSNHFIVLEKLLGLYSGDTGSKISLAKGKRLPLAVGMRAGLKDVDAFHV